jgi:hypothetical protein
MIGLMASADPAVRSNPVNSSMGTQVVIAFKLSERLGELAQLSPTWAARAPETERLAEELRASASPDQGRTGTDFTLFNGTKDAEADLAWILDEVELHHGLASAAESPVVLIRLIGVELTPAVTSMLGSRGFSDIDREEEEIVAHWVAPE